MMDFAVLDGMVPEELAAWVRLWEEWPQREVFAHPGYVKLVARPVDRVLCAALTSGPCLVLFPFILRPVATEPWADPDEVSWDLIGPYGYGGAFASGCLSQTQPDFFDQLDRWLDVHSVVTSFVRMTLFPAQVLPFRGQVTPKALNVIRDLGPAPDDLWRDYEHKVRKNVSRAREAGLVFEIDPYGRGLDDFLGIYYATMDRRDAAASYYFPKEFFESIVEDLPGQFVFAHVRQGERIVSTELALVSADHAYSFLGGTLPEAFPMRPNDLLKHELFLWARRLGKKAFVLGGGYEGTDGIYRYKRSFAPGGVVDFHIGTAVHDSDAYERLVARRRSWELGRGSTWEPETGFFPAYRA